MNNTVGKYYFIYYVMRREEKITPENREINFCSLMNVSLYEDDKWTYDKIASFIIYVKMKLQNLLVFFF